MQGNRNDATQLTLSGSVCRELMQIICQQLAPAQSYLSASPRRSPASIACRSDGECTAEHRSGSDSPCTSGFQQCDDAITMQSRLRELMHLTTISSYSVLLYSSRLSAIVKVILATITLRHHRSDSRYCDDATTIQFRLRGANANHLPAISSCSSLLCGSRISVIAKVILGTVTTLPQFNSVYGELMQIICQQLAPVHLCCAVRGSRHRRGDSPAASPAALMQNVSANILSVGAHHRLHVSGRA